MFTLRLTSLLTFVLSFLLIITTSCKKSGSGENEDDQGGGVGTEKPGHIQGFGDTPGNPTGTQFVLPAGISLKGDIAGNEDGPTSSDCVFDGQGFWVVVKINLQSDSTVNHPVTVEFPPGLVIVSASEGFQSGLLVERVVVTVPPQDPNGGGGNCRATLLLSCLNASKKPSDATAKYNFGPVTNSPIIKKFIQRLSTKRILYSAYTAANDIDFVHNQEHIQEALWHLTDGEGLTEDDEFYLNSLPDK